MTAFPGPKRALWEEKRTAGLFSFVKRQNPVTLFLMLKKCGTGPENACDWIDFTYF